MSATCLWCGRSYEPRRVGEAQRFCSTVDRRAYDQATRAGVRHALAIGALTVADLRKAPPAMGALVPGPSEAATASEGPDAQWTPAPPREVPPWGNFSGWRSAR